MNGVRKITIIQSYRLGQQGLIGASHLRQAVMGMLVLVSDLHLTDTTERSTFDARRFIASLNSLVKEAAGAGIKKVTVILLGDIFELLKSRRWIDEGVRPWEAVSDKHVRVVESIFESIVNCNAEFFDGLSRLSKSYPFVEFKYLAGNHDHPIYTEMGEKARLLLKDALPVGGEGKKLSQYLFDPAHEIIARHGHEWDPENRYRKGQAAIGDAIVIELLLSLPILVARNMKIDIDDPSLSFLHELDNVLPQTPAVMAKWILRGLDRMGDSYPNSGKVIQDTFIELADSLKAVTKAVSFETTKTATWWVTFLTKVVTGMAKHFGVLETAVKLPALGQGASPYWDFAKQDFAVTQNEATPHRFVVCGHTHNPELTVIDSGSSGILPRVYLNTGTWRRVHFAARSNGSALPIFETWDVGCFAVIYNKSEQSSGLPPYEFHRVIRGV